MRREDDLAAGVLEVNAITVRLKGGTTLQRYNEKPAGQICSDLRVHEGWRWRESNPRPSASTQDFSGRSLLVAFLSPSTRTDNVADRLSHCKCPALTP